MKKLSNPEIQTEAINYIKKNEEGLSEAQQGLGYDLVGNGKFIEVKGTAGDDASSGLILNSQEEYDCLKEHKSVMYRVLGVNNEGKKMTIIQLVWEDINPTLEPRWRVRLNESGKKKVEEALSKNP